MSNPPEGAKVSVYGEKGIVDYFQVDTNEVHIVFDDGSTEIFNRDEVEPLMEQVSSALVADLTEAIESRLASGHSDTCAIFIPADKQHPCSCGHDALDYAYEAFKGETK